MNVSDLNFEDHKSSISKTFEMLENTRQALTDNAEKLFAARQNLYSKKRLRAKTKQELSNLNDQLMSNIMNEIDPTTKKPKFSNDVKRKAEFLERSAANLQVRELEERLDAQTLSVEEAEKAFNAAEFDREVFILDYQLGLHLFKVFSNLVRKFDE